MALVLLIEDNGDEQRLWRKPQPLELTLFEEHVIFAVSGIGSRVRLRRRDPGH